MHLQFTEKQEALRKEVRDYFSTLMTPELRDATRGNEGGDAYKSVIRQLGKDGWLAVGWPEEYGGRGLSNIEQLIFFEETVHAEVPLPFVTINTVAPALMAFGSDEHKRDILPRIAAGECHFCIGYSEPGAGTDLAALKTAAVKDGDEYVINGTKVFTSSAEAADYVWLAARTDPDAAKPHKGITIFIVDTKQPGFSYAPIHTVGEVHTNMSYYSDVRCHESMIAGTLNGGWPLITSQLNHERIGLAAYYVQGTMMYKRVLEWARTEENGQRPIDQPWVAQTLAEVYARLEACRMMTWRLAWMTDDSHPDPALASAAKAQSTETLIEVFNLLLGLVGKGGILKRGSSDAALDGELEMYYRRCQINTFGGGIAELMRDLVAGFGLGMTGYSRK